MVQTYNVCLQNIMHNLSETSISENYVIIKEILAKMAAWAQLIDNFVIEYNFRPIYPYYRSS